MADVFEQNLPSKANLSVATNGDYLRVVGSDNNSYKQLVNDVAKKIIENYTNSNLAGANQSVKAALDSLNSNMAFNSLTSGSLLTWAEGLADGEWHFRTNNAVSDTPIAYLLGVVYVKDGNRRILAYKMTSEECWTNFRTNAINWATWVRLPSRAEVDALGQIQSINAARTFTISNGYRGIMYITDSTISRCGEYFVVSNNSGLVSLRAVLEASDITITADTNALTLTPTDGTRSIMFTSLNGSVS